MPIEAQTLRSEGKAILPLSCQGAFSYEISGEKVQPRADLQSKTETLAPLPSLLQGRTSIHRVS
jgi:hypothetical protein